MTPEQQTELDKIAEKWASKSDAMLTYCDNAEESILADYFKSAILEYTAELQKDKERLDWCELHSIAVNRRPFIVVGRDEIDAAMRKE